jgi:aminopeptidase N
VKTEKSIPATIEGQKYSVEEAIGKKCPDFIFPNEEDYGYFRAELDHRSLEAAKTSLSKFSDPFTRHLLAYTLWEMVKAGSWRADEFGKAALTWIAVETNKNLIEDLSDMMANSRNNRISVTRILTGEARAKFSADLFRIARRKAENAQPGSDLQRIWFHLALRTASVADADWMQRIAEKKTKLSGLKLDPNLRWDILLAVARRRAIAPEVLDAAAKDDPSSAGQARLLEVKAATPDLAADFPALFALEKADGIYPNAHLKKAMGGYLNLENEERTKAWRTKFFASLENVAAKADDSYYRSFAQTLYPGVCSAEVAAETTAWLGAHPAAPTPLRVALSKMAFSENWCAAIRAGTPFPLWQSVGLK